MVMNIFTVGIDLALHLWKEKLVLMDWIGKEEIEDRI